MSKKVYSNPLEKTADKVMAIGNHLRISVRKMQTIDRNYQLTEKIHKAIKLLLAGAG